MKKILIIEDEPAMRANLRDILEMENFSPLLAANGREGIAAVRRELPDLILCDVLMPEQDGYEVLAALRADPATAHIPFVFLTAKGERNDIRAGMNLGADDYLVKPVRLNELLDAIAARLDRAQQQAGFKADFKSAVPLERLGLSPREAEILLWIAQGKTNCEAGTILNISAATVKKHLEHIYEKLHVEGRNAATIQALEVLSDRTAG
jgi:DNA-binding NarL/FixJ family response regulator